MFDCAAEGQVCFLCVCRSAEHMWRFTPSKQKKLLIWRLAMIQIPARLRYNISTLKWSELFCQGPAWRTKTSLEKQACIYACASLQVHVPINEVIKLRLNPVSVVISLQVLTNLSLSPWNKTHSIQTLRDVCWRGLSLEYNNIKQKRERARNGPERWIINEEGNKREMHNLAGFVAYFMVIISFHLEIAS